MAGGRGRREKRQGERFSRPRQAGAPAQPVGLAVQLPNNSLKQALLHSPPPLPRRSLRAAGAQPRAPPACSRPPGR